ncbi:MAG: galactose oxidase [Symploca sp. SIO2G7]|nr:galactose oxidase [Symploca sp. SIO2G7]
MMFGGFIAANGGRWSASRDVLKLVGDEWQTIGTLPNAQTETVAAVFNDQIHFAGGRAPSGQSNANWGDQADVATHQIYDPKSGETSNAVPLPMARNSAASFVIGNQWHVVGGRTVNGGNSDRHDIYDFSDQRWRQGAPMPQAQGGLAAATVGANAYVFGGEFFSSDGGGVYSEVWHYESTTERWQQAGTMPVPRHGLGAVAVDQEIYVLAGATEAGGSGTSNRVAVFSP